MGKASWGLGESDEIFPGRTALKKLGGGRRCETYLAWDERLHSQVVVKMLRPDQIEDPGALRDLQREASTLERLSHPMLVRSFGTEAEGPRPHIVLEHFEGPTLRKLVSGFGPLPLEQLVPLAVRVAGVLHYMATEGIVHLDVKPGNIIMEAPPKMIDLSLARPIEVAGRLKKPIGTKAYMAPEQCDPVELGPPGPAADVWGLGATLFQAATGEKPYEAAESAGEGSSDGEKRSDYPQLYRDRRPWPKDVPVRVMETIDACLAWAPETRPAPAEVAQRFGPLMSELPDRPRLRRARPRFFA